MFHSFILCYLILFIKEDICSSSSFSLSTISYPQKQPEHLKQCKWTVHVTKTRLIQWHKLYVSLHLMDILLISLLRHFDTNKHSLMWRKYKNHSWIWWIILNRHSYNHKYKYKYKYNSYNSRLSEQFWEESFRFANLSALDLCMCVCVLWSNWANLANEMGQWRRWWKKEKLVKEQTRGKYWANWITQRITNAIWSGFCKEQVQRKREKIPPLEWG